MKLAAERTYALRLVDIDGNATEHRPGPALDLIATIGAALTRMSWGDGLRIDLGLGEYTIDAIEHGWRVFCPGSSGTERHTQRMLDQLRQRMIEGLLWYVAGRPTGYPGGFTAGRWNREEMAWALRLLVSLGCTVLYRSATTQHNVTAAVAVSWTEVRYGDWRDPRPLGDVPHLTICEDEEIPADLTRDRTSYSPCAFCEAFGELSRECGEAAGAAA